MHYKGSKMNKKEAIISVVLTTFFLNGCAGFNRHAYNTIQETQRQHCYKLIGHMREDCLARLKTSYDEYEKKRKQDPDDGN